MRLLIYARELPQWGQNLAHAEYRFLDRDFDVAISHNLRKIIVGFEVF